MQRSLNVRKSPSGANCFQPRLEILEDRCLPSYTLTDLGTLGGRDSFADAIAGRRVVGLADNSSQSFHAFLYTRAGMQDLGTLGGATSNAHGIAGKYIVGSSQLASGQSHAFVYTNGTMTDIGTLSGDPSGFSAATAVNTLGQVTGGSFNASGSFDAFLYQNGTMTDIGAGGGSTLGNAINKQGVIVGQWDMLHGPSHAFLWNGTLNDLGTLGGTFSTAYGVNNHGTVVGTSAMPGDMVEDAFLYTNGTMTDLGGLLGNTSSTGFAVNQLNQVVGSSSIAGGEHAFLYSQGAMVDLNTFIPANSGFLLQRATGITNKGLICGWGTINGQLGNHAFLLTPTGSANLADEEDSDGSASDPGVAVPSGASTIVAAAMTNRVSESFSGAATAAPQFSKAILVAGSEVLVQGAGITRAASNEHHAWGATARPTAKEWFAAFLPFIADVEGGVENWWSGAQTSGSRFLHW